MKIDNSFERYIKTGDKRYDYSVSHLFGWVLDIGCGDGYGMYLMGKNKNIIGTITGLDSQEEVINKAKENLKGHNVIFINCKAENIPCASNLFDCIHCGQTLEHVKDEKGVIEEIKRVVKNRVIFSVPINGGISEQHVREYKSEKEFTDLISKYFKVLSTKIFIDEKKHKRIVLIAEK